ncbi:hypothetical protein FIE12Z_8218 [Fusarium flagelliforme]|uniref:Uncharacterized protein n=1 Tax=Fusarium flagelliforme TaxID=2675880 RepID=A0A395MI14_9HYPO|nr:hypothetical protein FIE12Z_8218 [Fusarium flagelliforme]
MAPNDETSKSNTASNSKAAGSGSGDADLAQQQNTMLQIRFGENSSPHFALPLSPRLASCGLNTPSPRIFPISIHLHHEFPIPRLPILVPLPWNSSLAHFTIGVALVVGPGSQSMLSESVDATCLSTEYPLFPTLQPVNGPDKVPDLTLMPEPLDSCAIDHRFKWFRGEQAATNLENNLSNLESRLDAILAALEANSNLQASPAANAAQTVESRKAGTTDSKERPQDGANGDAVKDKKDTA